MSSIVTSGALDQAIAAPAPPDRAAAGWPLRLRLGVGLLAAIALVTLVGPLLLPSPTEQHLDQALAAPSAGHPLGTDQLGRDILARTLGGMRIDLLIGVGALVVPFVVGTLLGAVAGWRGGWVGHAIGIAADVVQAFPYYLLIIVLVFFLGAGVKSIFIAVALVAWVSYMHIVRAAVQSAVRQNYIVAALGSGLSRRRVFLRHMLPNVIGQPLTYLTTDIVVVIVGTATLSYLGLGIAPPTPELGAMIADGQQFIAARPLGAVVPGLAVALIGAAFALIGDGVKQRVDG